MTRNRNMVSVGASNSQRAQLPGLPAVPRSIDSNLYSFLESVKERLEVREGSRGNPFEAVVTRRDLRNMGLLTPSGASSLNSAEANDGLVLSTDSGLTTISVNDLVDKIKASRAFQSLVKRLDDPSRFEHYPTAIQDVLLASLAEEAAKRGADIQLLEQKMQTDLQSLALRVQTITASVSVATAGIRETQFAYATESTAQAAKITQLEASLGNYYQDGTEGKVSLEETLEVEADRLRGLFANYQVKLTAGGAFGAFSLSAYESPDQEETVSQFLIAADKFAFTTPSGETFPFVADASGVYLQNLLMLRDSAGNPIFTVGGVIDKTRVNGLGELAGLSTLPASRLADPQNITINGRPLDKMGALAFKNSLSISEINDIGQFVIQSSQVSGLGTLATSNSLTAEQIVGLGSFVEDKAAQFVAIKGGTEYAAGSGLSFRLGLADSALGNTFLSAGSFKNTTGSGVGVLGEGPAFGVVGLGTGGGSGVAGADVTNTFRGILGSATAGGTFVGGSNTTTLATSTHAAIFSGAVSPFTGSHDGLMAVPAQVGDILVDVQVVHRLSISDVLTEVAPSSTPNQKAVIGVFAGYADGHTPVALGGGEIPAGMRSVIVNSIGEGQILVCGEGGDLDTGDLIVSSSMVGKGMRQADDIIRSCSVAKVREPVVFSGPADVRLVACTYLCG